MTLQRIIIATGYGQTCNQIFQIAHWMPVAIETGAALHFPGFARYAANFAGTAGPGTPRFPMSAKDLGTAERAAVRVLGRLNRMSEGVISAALGGIDLYPGHAVFNLAEGDELNPRSVVAQVGKASTLWVRGWRFRDREGLRANRQVVAAFFAPIASVQAMADRAIEAARRNVDVVVGVHLRRGDYRGSNEGKYFFDDAAMAAVLGRLAALIAPRRCRFLLASNEAVDLAAYRSVDVVPAPGHAVGDLYVLAACDYILGPPSTYSMWASWYGGVPLHHLSNPGDAISIGDFSVVSLP